MSEKGFIAITRGSLDHPVVGATKPYCRYAAWHWMLFEAGYDGRQVRASNGRQVAVIDLKRGQFSHSISFMADAFGWSEKKIRGFLIGLERVGQIARQTDRQQQVITICNYEAHQKSGRQTDRQSTGQTDSQWTGNGQELKQSNKETKELPLRALIENLAGKQEITRQDVYTLGSKVVAKNYGALVTGLCQHYGNDYLAVKEILVQSLDKAKRSDWLWGVIHHTERPKTPSHILYPPEIYGNLR